ncbi:Glycoside hydrolase family 17 [Sesbania bispinosa]|nr:Glycoside hydrolase family 17 [Sesbania bispinosa]
MALHSILDFDFSFKLFKVFRVDLASRVSLSSSFRFAILRRCELRSGHRQPSVAGGHDQAPQSSEPPTGHSGSSLCSQLDDSVGECERVAFYPVSNIILITVGNEIMTSGDQGLISQLLPAMQNVHNALNLASHGDIKVSTVHSMVVLSQSDPPHLPGRSARLSRTPSNSCWLFIKITKHPSQSTRTRFLLFGVEGKEEKSFFPPGKMKRIHHIQRTLIAILETSLIYKNQ